MELDNVQLYEGQYSVSFTVDGVTKNTWTDWGLIPSTRHSEPVNGVWSQAVTAPGTNGENNLVRLYPYSVANNTKALKGALRKDNRDRILSEEKYAGKYHAYDIFQPKSGALSFIIADQTVSFFEKQKEIANFMHCKNGTMTMDSYPGETLNVFITVEGPSSGETYSSVSISYSILE